MTGARFPTIFAEIRQICPLTSSLKYTVHDVAGGFSTIGENYGLSGSSEHTLEEDEGFGKRVRFRWMYSQTPGRIQKVDPLIWGPLLLRVLYRNPRIKGSTFWIPRVWAGILLNAVWEMQYGRH